ncbi:hypothetical protein NOJ05_19580 [Neorhizobium galegae]|uniref:hypothetical protein n=1 Tax=Neorhizobium galegae TaxID=399 RepID=UPI002104EF36|nr:hypothetical protein [Neorhizobium galegae]MCQ1779413.1 hypothetical protein [Neorhizobium galegae]MCQ1795573.1 hypothetical protein [Neorhizobium galegae]
MKHIPMPGSAKLESLVIKSVCNKNGWQSHEAAWLAAYASYYVNKGNAWKLNPIGLSVKKQQYDLYDKRKGGGPLLRLRQTPGLLSCPMCGSSTTGHLDHYLPRTVYQEFSILKANLIPACNHCNSGSKRMTVKGGKGERFIHPYFDFWADKPIWYIRFVGPLEAVRFKPTARKTLLPNREAIISFHLKNVLGDQFHRSMEVKWSTLPRDMLLRLKYTNLQLSDVREQLQEELLSAVATTGENGWGSAFFRGLLRDQVATEFVWNEILKL